jgi:predicted DNA-binding antitoxin AbrB/MazE fold protein
MDLEVNAIFENGLLRPLGPVTLGERAEVHLKISPIAPDDDSTREGELARQRHAVSEMLAEFAGLPQPTEGETFSGTDHDRILYGRRT